MPVTAGMVKVNGSVNATAIGVVIPGIAPTTVPTTTPINNASALSMVAKIENAVLIVSSIYQPPISSGSRIPVGIGILATLVKNQYTLTGNKRGISDSDSRLRSPANSKSANKTIADESTKPSTDKLR